MDVEPSLEVVVQVQVEVEVVVPVQVEVEVEDLHWGCRWRYRRRW